MEGQALSKEYFSRYSNKLFKLAMIYLGRCEDAQDVVQEAFIRFLQHTPSFADDSHVEAWFIRVTINICKDLLKSKWQKTLLSEQLSEIVVHQNFGEESETIVSLLKLPKKYKAVIFLFYYDDFSITKIAKVLNVTEGTVKMRLSRARKLLKIELEGDDEDEER